MQFKNSVISLFLFFFISSASQANGDLIRLTGSTKTGTEFDLVPFDPLDPKLFSDWERYLSAAKGLGEIIPNPLVVVKVRDSFDNVWFIYSQDKIHCGVIYAHVEEINGKYFAEISYFIGKEYRGKGFASASLKKVVQHLVRPDRVPLLHVELKIPEHHLASERVAQQAGFVKKPFRVEVSSQLHGYYWNLASDD